MAICVATWAYYPHEVANGAGSSRRGRPMRSCDVSSEQLGAWGFPVQETDTIVGMKMVVVEGTSRREALRLAAAAGLCTLVLVLPWAERVAREEKRLAAKLAATPSLEKMAQVEAWLAENR